MNKNWAMTWVQMDALDNLIYETKALLEVVSDGLLNQDCPSNNEDSAVVIRQAVGKITRVGEIHEQMWEQQREAKLEGLDDGGTDEDADEEEDFDTKDLFSDFPFSADETDIAPKEMSEAVYEAQKRRHQSPTSFTVEELAKNEDGSATFMVDGSAEDMKKLFEVFFTQAIINGIKYTAADNDKETAKMNALKVAREFEFMMRLWEGMDSFDYSPSCEEKRKELEEALEAAGE